MEAKAFWNARADLGEQAGTQDTILHRLEVEEIAKHVKDGMRILDVGCGNGTTAIELRMRSRTSIWGIDYSEAMIREANKILWNDAAVIADVVAFSLQDIMALTLDLGRFDLIYTKRCLINLDSWEKQQQAIRNILGLLKPGGQYLMVESSRDGLDRLNELRALVELPAIEAPWHNRYLRDEEITDLAIATARDTDFFLVDEVDFTATYYFLSRVVNAHLAALDGKEPAYDAPVNKLALKLPSIGDCGQTRMWIWRKSR